MLRVRSHLGVGKVGDRVRVGGDELAPGVLVDAQLGVLYLVVVDIPVESDDHGYRKKQRENKEKTKRRANRTEKRRKKDDVRRSRRHWFLCFRSAISPPFRNPLPDGRASADDGRSLGYSGHTEDYCTLALHAFSC